MTSHRKSGSLKQQVGQGSFVVGSYCSFGGWDCRKDRLFEVQITRTQIPWCETRSSNRRENSRTYDSLRESLHPNVWIDGESKRIELHRVCGETWEFGEPVSTGTTAPSKSSEFCSLINSVMFGGAQVRAGEHLAPSVKLKSTKINRSYGLVPLAMNALLS